jgi:predicted phosphoribosyltransferase
MYFKDRSHAGMLLADKLQSYRFENTAIIALSDGGVVVASEIAIKLHCAMMLLLTEDIKLPGELDALAVVDQNGGFTYNSMFSAGQLEGFTKEYQTFIEQSKRQQFSTINRLLSDGGIIEPHLLYGRHIILVADGLQTGISLDAAVQYLKPIKTESIIIATPIASVAAVDKMHLLSDKIVCLSVTENYINTEHYYEDNVLPSHEKIIKTIQSIVLHWK